MKSKMQKFSTVQKRKAVNQRKRDFKKIQEKRKKKKKTDDEEIEILSSKLWPKFDDKNKVEFRIQYNIQLDLVIVLVLVGIPVDLKSQI